MKKMLISLLFVTGCVTQPAAPCSVDEGLQVNEQGEVVHGISQCAMCERFRAAYEERAAQLGCEQPFPSEACVDEGLTDCHVGLIEEWADFSWATRCSDLYEHVRRPDTYHGFICGDACETTGTHEFECCEGTPYELRSWRRCPYWCYGLSECGSDPECVALYEETL